MGQPVVVTERATSTPGMVRFDLNRSLTGMGHERYRAGQEVEGDRPPDVVARRLLERGGVKEVHIFSNTITVTLESGGDASGIKETLENLYVHYLPGVQPSIPG
jgi:hypothetical protein